MIQRLRDLIGNIDRGVLWGAGLIVSVLAVVMLLSRVSPASNTGEIQLTIDAASTQSNLYVPTLAANLTRTPAQAALTGSAPTLSVAGQRTIRQFAASATAASQRDEVAQGAVQAAGPPNTPDCGDFRTAWASALPNETATLTLLYPELVEPSEVLVYQSYNPGFVTRIEVVDLYNNVHTVYEGTAQPIAQCPFTLVVPIPDADYETSKLIVTVDQSTSTGGWNQIDAVELIGIKH